MLNKLRQGLSTTARIRHFLPNEIPPNLQVDREMRESTLRNGMRVFTEYWPSALSHVTIFIKCGSRNETENTSGTAHFLEHLHFKGTGRRRREQLELDVENMGGQLNAYTARENTSYTMNVFNKNLKDAVEILGDMLTNSLYSAQAVENERDTIYRELIETRKMQFESCIEISHRAAFKDHQMGLPILGKIQNMYSISRDMIVNYHQANYYGSNFIVAAGGGVDHDQLCHLLETHFNKLRLKPVSTPNNPSKPQFKNEVFLMGSELTENLNVGLFWEAPPWKHPKYYHFLVLQRLLADKPENEMEAEIFYRSNLNAFQKRLLTAQEIFTQKAVYTPYHDTGLFGNYFVATPEKGIQECIDMTQLIFQQYANRINEEELQRAKRRLFIELCQHETGNDITQAIANQILYFDRRIYRQEIAQNLAAITCEDLQRTTKEWLVGKPFSLTLWGNIQSIVDKYGAERVGHH